MPSRLVEYDSVRRRLWILGQRCHHGATGALVAGLALTGLAGRTVSPAGSALLAATGSALMLHDRHDVALWFALGHQHQP